MPSGKGLLGKPGAGQCNRVYSRSFAIGEEPSGQNKQGEWGFLAKEQVWGVGVGNYCSKLRDRVVLAHGLGGIPAEGQAIRRHLGVAG